ncbi:MAG TPA: helix-turn-helix domain-containing protein [bacterium]|jgi:AraC-like DNA-binding protein|nr:helix-turn-helix domain-containing protein [bacterium]
MNLQAPEVKYEANGLSSMKETRPGTFQQSPHSHNEIEILLIERGQGVWLMSGTNTTLKAGSLIVFWAVRPHQLIKASDNLVLHWLTMPLTVFVEWRLPEIFTKSILAGRVFLEPDKTMFPFDRRSLENWHRDLRDPDQERQRLALLEIEARLRRLAITFHDEKAPRGQELSTSGTFNHHYFDKISQIADFVSKNFSQPMPVVDIAKHINMHPASATKLFKKICGMSLMQYITQHRIFHAQRLLMSTDMKIVDVALDSGYQSASRFYAAFKDFCGLSPQEYRHSVRKPAIPIPK